MNKRFSTRNEAVTRLIVEPITASGLFADEDEIRAAYDLDAIEDECIEWGVDYDEQGRELVQTGGFDYTAAYAMDEDGDQDTEAFWSLVERHAR